MIQIKQCVIGGLLALLCGVPPAASSPTSPYADPPPSPSILTLHAGILVAPLERYHNAGNGWSRDWWNPAYFEVTPEQIALREGLWQAAVRRGVQAYQARGGRDGIAMTYPFGGHVICLLEQETIDLINDVLARPQRRDVPQFARFVAWHEYGHCLYNLERMRVGHFPQASEDRYPSEVFADGYALVMAWRQQRIDLYPWLKALRDRNLRERYNNRHWTPPALAFWRPLIRTLEDAELEGALFAWVQGADLYALREAAQRSSPASP